MEDTAADRLKSQTGTLHNKTLQNNNNNNNASYYINETVLQLRAHPPPLNTIVASKNQITGSVEWLLDFSIIGFAKCGTSFLKSWLSKSPSVYMDDREIPGFALQRPGAVAEHFYNVVLSSSENNNNNSIPQKIGMKSPSDISSTQALTYYHQFFPNTKLIVLLRHPVLWFQSFYNFRYRNIIHRSNNNNSNPHLATTKYSSSSSSSLHRPSAPPMLPPDLLIGSCWKGKAYANSSYSCHPESDKGCDTKKHTVCTNQARFHQVISRLGLTPLSSKEWDLLDHHTMTIVPQHNSVLFIELTQLWYDESENSTNSQVQSVLQQFIGLTDLPPLPTYHVPYERVDDDDGDDVGEIDICNDMYRDLRKLLVSHGQRASEWIVDYLLQSDRVIVSNRDEFIHLMQQWKLDPCVS